MTFVAEFFAACMTVSTSTQADISSVTKSYNFLSDSLQEFPMVETHIVSVFYTVLVCRIGHFEERFAIVRGLCENEGYYTVTNWEKNDQ